MSSDRAIELDPTSAIAHYCRGASKAYLGDYYGAIADYDRSIELDPRDAVAFGNRAVAKSNVGDVRGAIADYEAALRLEPNATWAPQLRQSLAVARSRVVGQE